MSLVMLPLVDRWPNRTRVSLAVDPLDKLPSPIGIHAFRPCKLRRYQPLALLLTTDNNISMPLVVSALTLPKDIEPLVSLSRISLVSIQIVAILSGVSTCIPRPAALAPSVMDFKRARTNTPWAVVELNKAVST